MFITLRIFISLCFKACIYSMDLCPDLKGRESPRDLKDRRLKILNVADTDRQLPYRCYWLITSHQVGCLLVCPRILNCKNTLRVSTKTLVIPHGRGMQNLNDLCDTTCKNYILLKVKKTVFLCMTGK